MATDTDVALPDGLAARQATQAAAWPTRHRGAWRGGGPSLCALCAALAVAAAAMAGQAEPPAPRPSKPEPILTIVLRYDDWFAAAASPERKRAVDLKVLELAVRHRVPITIAVTPAAIALAAGEAAAHPGPSPAGGEPSYAVLRPGDPMLEPLLVARRDATVEIALHGLHHVDRAAGLTAPPAPSVSAEFAGRPYEAQLADLERGVALLAEAGLPRPKTFVPPFDVYDQATCRACIAAGMATVSAEFEGPLCPPATACRLLPHTAGLAELKDMDKLVAAAQGVGGRGGIVVAELHSYDFEEGRSEKRRTFGTLADFGQLLAKLAADERIRLATVSEAVAAQGDALSAERYEAARVFLGRNRIVFGVRILPYRFLPDHRLRYVYWSAATYRSLNRRLLVLEGATFGVVLAGGLAVGLVLAALLGRWRRPFAAGFALAAAGGGVYVSTLPVARVALGGAFAGGLAVAVGANALVRRLRRRAPGAEAPAGEGEAGRSGRGPLWLALAFLGAALVYEFLWMARKPSVDGMAFVVNKVGLRVALSGVQFQAFAFASGLLGLGCVAAAWAAARRAVRRAGGRAGGGGAWRLALAALVFLIFAIPFYHAIAWADGRVYSGTAYPAAWSRDQVLRELGLVSSTRLLWLAAAVALVGHLALSRRSRAAELAGRAVAAVARVPHPVLVAVAALAFVGLAVAFSLLVFDGQPHYPDATAYLLTARMFAAGHLTLPVVGSREFFDPALLPFPAATYLFLGDRWFCYGAPGAPALYVAGVLLGCPWLVPPLLGGALVVAAWLLTREIFGATAALVALPLVALSPWLVFMSGEFLNHVPCALALVLFLLAALRAMERASWRAGAMAGLLLGLGAAIRPPTALLVGLPVAAAWLGWLVLRPARAWRPTLAAALALAIPLGALLLYNAGTTGNATTFGYQAYARQARAAARAAAPAPSSQPAPRWRWRPAVGLANFTQMAYQMGPTAWRWPVPAAGLMVGALVLLGLGAREGRRGAAAIVALSAAALPVGYAFLGNVVEGLHGPRYVFEALPLLAVLAGGSVVLAWRRLAEAGAGPARARGALSVVLLGCFAYGAGSALTEGLRPLRHYLGVDVRMFRVVAAQAQRPALVFVPVDETDESTSRFFAAIGQNAPDLDGPIVYARDLGPGNRVLAEARPGRHCYRWDFERFALVPLGGAEGLGPDGSSPQEGEP